MAGTVPAPGAGTVAGGGTQQPGGVLGPDGTFYVGGADQYAPGSTPIGSNRGGPSLPQLGQPWPGAFAPPPPAPPATPEAPPHPALPNPDQGYVDNFMASVARQRAAIDNQLAASTQQLGARRDAAAGVVAGLPANFNAHFKQAQKMYGTEHGVAAGHATGNDTAIGANANDRLMQGAMQNTNAAAQSTVPLLNEGVVANYGQGLDTLNAAHTGAEGQIDSTVGQFDAQQAAAAQQQAAQAAAQAQAEQYNRADAATANQYATAGQQAGFAHDKDMAQWQYDHPTTTAASQAAQTINTPAGPMTEAQALQYSQHYNYTGPQGWLNAETTGPTIANHILHLINVGDSNGLTKVWGSLDPDQIQWLGLNKGLTKTTKKG